MVIYDFEPGDLVSINIELMRKLWGENYNPSCTASFREGEVYVVKEVQPNRDYIGYGGTLYVERDSVGSTTNGWARAFFKPVGGPW